MITPAGAECTFYYEDFARGANKSECRAAVGPRSAAWEPRDCARCAVPAILAANGSPHLELRVTVRAGVLGIGRRVDVDAWCALHGLIESDPRTGCPACNAEANELLRGAFD